MDTASGPLTGLKVLEFAGQGPVPFCGMMLSDMGADVLRIDRKGGEPPPKHEVTFRGRYSVALDLKCPAATQLCLRLAEQCEILLEGFRPGVMERLGLGPTVVRSRNPRIVYGRMTGWGQTGCLADVAGHDINYLAVSGALHAIGTKERPAIPINLIGDYGGGAMYLAFGVLAALLHARQSGQGQIIDCAMTDGVVSLLAQIWGHFAKGRWKDERQANVIDGGSPFYNSYRCADGRFIAIASIEPKFYAALLDRLQIRDSAFEAQWDRARWGECKSKLAELFATKTRDEWCAVFEGSDACFAPVLSLSEAASHRYHEERQSFIELEGLLQPAPAPRFSATPARARGGVASIGGDNRQTLAHWGIAPAEIETLEKAGAI